ncbi:hypothetical protein PAPYR_4787 [Paratrimastix pyriformis]|uniref:Uncharacterized protein n=1 Tax=Paratrimastix pyriformis TaxID=342808 RepID=A0ABQ8UJ64_9EUKA|nr:hypothetical protein PAPYR_4787 [Paratrimastix pyriformis]
MDFSTNQYRVRPVKEGPIWTDMVLREEFSTAEDEESERAFHQVTKFLEPQYQQQTARNVAHRCVDGRSKHTFYGTLGGDFCDFLLCLSVIEEVSGIQFTEDAIARTLVDYLQATEQPFYWHSDKTAMEMLRQVAGLLPKDFCALSSVNPWYHTRLMSAMLSSSACVGCHHLRAILEHTEEFRVRPQLVYGLMTGYLRLYWDPKNPLSGRLIFEVLEGDHNEEALILLRDAGCPPLCPTGLERHSYMVYHMARADTSRAAMATALLTHCQASLGLPTAPDRAAILDGIAARATLHCRLMLQYCHGVPHYQVQKNSGSTPPAGLYLRAGQRRPELEGDM